MPKLLKKDPSGGSVPAAAPTPTAAGGVNPVLGPLPRGVKSAVCASEALPNGNTLLQIELTPEVSAAGGHAMVDGTDIVLVLDASFSMYASAYRNLKVFDVVDKVVGFLNPFDADGIDVYLHSLRDVPFKHMGAITTPGEAQQHLTDFVEISTARKLMGTRTVCAPVLRDIVHRLKEQKGSANVFISVLTDGEFDDEADVERAIVELGKKYNSKEEPFGFKLHFTGFGNLQFKFLRKLDDELETKYPGFIDCVDFDTAAEIENTVQHMVKEFQSTVICAGSNGTVSVECASGVVKVGDAKTSRFEDGDFYSGFEVVPAVVNLGVELKGRPSNVTVTLGFETVGGQVVEIPLTVRF